MYKSLSIYLYQNNYYEDLVLELYEIEHSKKEILKKVSTIKDFKYLDQNDKDDLLELINREVMVLHDLMKANSFLILNKNRFFYFNYEIDPFISIELTTFPSLKNIVALRFPSFLYIFHAPSLFPLTKLPSSFF